MAPRTGANLAKDRSVTGSGGEYSSRRPHIIDSRDRAYLAQALARAAVQPGVSAATTEQCIYQIGLVLAREARRFDLGAWQRKIREWRVIRRHK